jgi:hypothetical protein
MMASLMLELNMKPAKGGRTLTDAGHIGAFEGAIEAA